MEKFIIAEHEQIFQFFNENWRKKWKLLRLDIFKRVFALDAYCEELYTFTDFLLKLTTLILSARKIFLNQCSLQNFMNGQLKFPFLSNIYLSVAGSDFSTRGCCPKKNHSYLKILFYCSQNSSYISNKEFFVIFQF